MYIPKVHITAWKKVRNADMSGIKYGLSHDVEKKK